MVPIAPSMMRMRVARASSSCCRRRLSMKARLSLPLLYLLLRKFRVEAISESAHAADKGHRAGPLDLLTQPENVDVDSAVGHGTVVAPNRVQQLLAAEYDARTAHQKLEQAEFGGGQSDLLPGELHAAAGAVELEVARFEHLGSRRLATEVNLDARDQLADEEWLDDIV